MCETGISQESWTGFSKPYTLIPVIFNVNIFILLDLQWVWMLLNLKATLKERTLLQNSVMRFPTSGDSKQKSVNLCLLG